MPHRTLSIKNDYQRKISYDWPSPVSSTIRPIFSELMIFTDLFHESPGNVWVKLEVAL